MLNRDKGRIHNALLRYWVYLDDLSIPDIWRVFADYAIRFFQRILGKDVLSKEYEEIFAKRFKYTLILVSFSLTTCAIILGNYLDESFDLFEHDYFHSLPVFLFALFIVNLVFDAATGLVSVKFLSMMRRSTTCKALVLMVIDIILAFFFTVACFCFVDFIAGDTAMYGDLSLMDFIETADRVLARFLGKNPYIEFNAQIGLFPLIYSCTTFIPSLIYLTILVILMISKAILETTIRATKYFFEAATEVKEDKDLKVFTLTGSFFSAIVILLTGFTKLCQTLQ